MLEALYNSTQPNQSQERPSDDQMPAPRTQVQMLTDEGVKQQVTDVVDMGAADAKPEPAADATETDPQSETLQALLDQHDASETPEPTTDAPTKDEAPNFDAPEMQAFADQFKQMMGVDLKEAYATFTQMQQQLQEANVAREQAAVQQTVNSLKTDWGVNDAEFTSRVDAVLRYADKLKPELRAQLDNADGIKLIWSQIEKRQSSAPSASASAASPKSTQSGTFKQSELAAMMRNEPQKYAAMQDTIAKAFAEGKIVYDL